MLVYYVAVKFYFGRFLVDRNDMEYLRGQGVSMDGFGEIIESAREKVKEINSRFLKQEQQTEDLFKAGN